MSQRGKRYRATKSFTLPDVEELELFESDEENPALMDLLRLLISRLTQFAERQRVLTLKQVPIHLICMWQLMTLSAPFEGCNLHSTFDRLRAEITSGHRNLKVM